MSWLFGISGHIKTDHTKKVSPLKRSALFQYQSEDHLLLAGGNENTSASNAANRQVWVVCGIGINESGIIRRGEWDIRIKKLKEQRIQCDGHFAGVSISGDQIMFFNDPLGIRTIYFYQTPEILIFSTRLDWIAQFCGTLEFDFTKLGAQWLLINAVTPDCPLKDCLKLGQGGIAKYESGKLDIKHYPFSPEYSDKKSHEPFLETIKNLVSLPNRESLKTLLALSGGLDSRFLLSALLGSGLSDFSVYSFGHKNNPDRLTAQSIAKKSGINFHEFDYSSPDLEHSLDLASEYVTQTCGTSPVYKLFTLQFYNTFRNSNTIIIDGGFGEISRRRYLNRIKLIWLFKRKKFNNKDIATALFNPKPAIFNNDINQLLQQGSSFQIEKALGEMPPVNTYQIDNWLDLLAVRTRLPFLIGYEQTRTDQIVRTFMPFAQLSLINRIFNISVPQRSNSVILKNYIRKTTPHLAAFPLAKEGVSYPFGLGTLSTSLWIKTATRRGRAFRDPYLYNFLNSNREYILDIVNSHSLLQSSVFNPDIRNKVLQFYQGESGSADSIAWWLTMDIWQKELTTKQSIKAPI